MKALSRSIVFATLVALTLIVAACNGDDGDDTAPPEDTDTTTVTDDTDDEVTDDTVAEDEDPAVDDAATDDVTPTDDTDATPEADDTAVADDADETAVADDATPATDDADDTATVDEDVDQILDNAAERAEELTSARFELDGTGYIEVDEIGEVTIENAEGAVERPGRAQVEFDLDLDGMEVPLSVVSIDGDVYFTDVFTGEWQSAPEEFQFNPSVIFDENDGIPALIREIEDAEILGEEEIDGRQTYQIYGVIDGDTVQQGTAGTFQANEDVDFNVWIDQETYDVLQVRAEDPTEETDSVWEMRIFDHDEEVDIEDPSADDS